MNQYSESSPQDNKLRYYEEHIIGGILAGTVNIDDVQLDSWDLLEMGDFLSLMRRMRNAGTPIDPESVYLESIGIDALSFYGIADLQRWAGLPTSSASVMEACRRLRGESLKVNLKDSLEELLARGEEMSGPGMLQRLQTMVYESTEGFSDIRRGFISLAEIAPKARKVYEDLHKNISYAVPTGFTALDNSLLDGYSKGDLHLIAGMTAAGKSALAWCQAKRQAMMGYGVGVVSREMSDIENLMRLQASTSGLPRHFIRKGMPSTDLQRLLNDLEETSKLPIWINTETGTVQDLRLQVKGMVDEFGLAILYIDTMQLMKTMQKQQRRDLEVGDISRSLKEIAMDNNIPVVGLSQFNRGAMNASIYDLLGYLKESSSLEQDATTITHIQLEKQEEGVFSGKTRPAKATVLKNRNGAPFIGHPLNYRGEIFEFTEAY